MIKKLLTIILIVSIFFTYEALASQESFCEGFKEGYLSIKKNVLVIPICPIKPIASFDSTDFQLGIKEGVQQAQKN